MKTVSNTGYIISIIIPYTHSVLNYNNLKKILEFYQNFGNAEIIVVEQGNFKNLGLINYNINKYILSEVDKYTSKEYNKALLYNIGAKYATTELIILADNITFINPHLLMKSVEAILENETLSAISCSNKIMYLDENNSKILLDQLLNTDMTPYIKPVLNIFDSLFIIRKNIYFEYSGFNETLVGDDLNLFMHELYTRNISIGFIENLYAIKLFDNSGFYYKADTYNKSRSTLEKIFVLLKENNLDRLKKYVSTIKNIGMKNKYV